ncbi:MAG TPA: hypothetical protein VNJ51_05270 [Candidatus Dormibacteraeota bacterium]|nr:hypothetical protein [Candidatus Dormibacteraeota bacterium]
MATAIGRTPIIGKTFAALILTVALLAGTMAPSLADTAGQRSTRNIVLGAAVLTAAIILYSDYQRRQAAGDDVVGYTRNGGVVYADGRVVFGNGTTLYLSTDGRTPCGYDGEGERCGRFVRAYRWRHDEGYHRGWYKHRHRERGDDDD